MIKFFHKIRQKLLREGKTTRYLKYAIGEICLVVIGILIALQLNLWKEERHKRAEEIQTLEQLKEEFTSNLNQLDEKISMRKSMLNASLHLLAYHDDLSLIHPDSVDIFLARTTVSPTFDPITNDLISSGRLYLISNLSLRRKLSTWTSELIQVTEEEAAWISLNRNSYKPFLRARYPLRNMYASKWSRLDVVKTLLLDKDGASNLSLGHSKKVPDYISFFTDPELENQLSSIASALMFANAQSIALRKSIIEILALIDEDLNKK